MRKISFAALMCATATMAAATGSAHSFNINKRMAQMPNRTSFNISVNAGKIMAESNLPRTVRLYNVLKQSDTEQDTTFTVTCKLFYDSYGRLTHCIRTIAELEIPGSTLHDISDTVDFNYYPNGLLHTITANSFYPSSIGIINTKQTMTNLYSGTTLIGYDYTYSSDYGAWTKGSSKFEKGLYKGTNVARISTVSDTTDTGEIDQTKQTFYVTDYNTADGSIGGIRYMLESDSVEETIIDIRNIRWRKWSGMSWFDNISYTDAYSGVSEETETLPLALFTKFFNTEANDVESFEVVTYSDGAPYDSTTVQASHDGSSLVYNTIISGGYNGPNYRYTPLDTLGSFNIYVNHIDINPTDHTYLGVNFLPDYFIKLITAPISRFEDFGIGLQADDLITYRDDYEVAHDTQHRLVRFATKYAHPYSDRVEYQIAEFSDFLTMTDVGEINTATTWTAIGGQGTIGVRNAGGMPLTVYAISGRLVYTSGSATDADINAHPGVYLVKVGNTCQKVIVR